VDDSLDGASPVVALPLRRGRVVLAALLLVLAAAAINVLREPRVTVELDTRTMFLYDGSVIRLLPRGSVVVVNVYMPYPGGLLREAGAVEAPGRLTLSIPTGGVLDAWLRSGLPRRGRYPLLSVVVVAYTPDGEYVGGVALDPLSALFRLHAKEYENPKKLDEVYQLLDRDPVRLLGEAYSGTLSLAGLVLYKVNVTHYIDLRGEACRGGDPGPGHCHHAWHVARRHGLHSGGL